MHKNVVLIIQARMGSERLPGKSMFDLAGDDVISFGLGEPDFQPPKQAIDAFYNAMLEGHNKYTTTAGLPILREKIAQSWDEYQTGMNSENVCITM